MTTGWLPAVTFFIFMSMYSKTSRVKLAGARSGGVGGWVVVVVVVVVCVWWWRKAPARIVLAKLFFFLVLIVAIHLSDEYAGGTRIVFRGRVADAIDIV